MMMKRTSWCLQERQLDVRIDAGGELRLSRAGGELPWRVDLGAALIQRRRKGRVRGARGWALGTGAAGAVVMGWCEVGLAFLRVRVGQECPTYLKASPRD